MEGARKIKILVLVDWFYPGYKAGGPIQSCRNFVAAMEEQFQIAVVTSDRDLGDQNAYPGIAVDQWNDYSPRTKVFYASALSVQQLKQLVEETTPDYIYINSMFSTRFAIFPLWLLWKNKIKVKPVLAPRGMLQQGAMQFRSRKKKLFLRLLKTSGLPRRITFHATDEQEKKDILSFFPAAGSIEVATNFPRMQQLPFSAAEKEPGTLKCIFISRLAPKKNIEYFLRILRQLPGGLRVSFDIRGEVEDKNYWQQCEDLIKALPANINVQYKGPVPNDEIPVLLQQYHVFVLPTLGENFGHAIFEALAAGRPVLISDKTPWHGLGKAKAGWDIPLQEIKSYIEILEKAAAMTTVEFNEWCRGAWQLAHDFIAQTDIRQQYLKLFNGDVHSRN